MVWDYAEANPLSESGGNISMLLERVVDSITFLPTQKAGIAKNADAAALRGSVQNVVISTDPPYYDNIGYADLSDFFYVWLRRSLSSFYPRHLQYTSCS